MIYVGIDDTDNAECGGTGRVARGIAAALREQFFVLGVSRHQLLVDDRVPYTRNNSCNVIHLHGSGLGARNSGLAEWVGELLRERSLPGSDPGLCVATEVVAGHPFGEAAQTRLVSQEDASVVARELEVPLRPLGGTGDGIIGALAGVILAAGGDDGRFVDLGTIRELDGVVSVEALLAAGVGEVRTRGGNRVASGMVDTLGGRVRPVLRRHLSVLLVEAVTDGTWRVVPQGKRHHGTGEEAECKVLPSD